MKSITVETANSLWRQVMKKRPLQVERVPLTEARGRVLAEDIRTPFAIPAFNKSAMDGYAVVYQEGRKDYKIAGVIGAGMVWEGIIEPGEALRIMTGAPLPDSCDTVIMQEAVETRGHIGDSLRLKGPVSLGQHVIGRGEECQADSLVLNKGLKIDSGVQSVLAGLGLCEVVVYRPLKALLLTSGREVVEPGKDLEAGQIYNSNRFLLEGLLRDTGIEDIVHYHVSDDPELLDQEIDRVLGLAKGKDFIVSSGGVSVGLFDSMPHIYQALGLETLYERISMRPGAASYGAIGQKGLMAFGLSGNPVAAYNGFMLLVRPALLQASGLADLEGGFLSCICDCDFTKLNPLDRYVQGRVYSQEGRLHFALALSQSSSAMVALAHVNALAYIPQGTKGIKKGDFIQILSTKDL